MHPRRCCSPLCAKPTLNDPPTDAEGGLRRLATSAYALHYYETATGLRFILVTDKGIADAQDALQSIFVDVFVPLIVRNPMYVRDQPVDSPKFAEALEAHVRGLPFFSSS